MAQTNIQKLMLLWLVITTVPGDNNGGIFFKQLTTAATAAEARADLATTLGLDVAVVNSFVNAAMGDAINSQIQDVQVAFHELVKTVIPGQYDGPECPFHVTDITGLLTA